MSINQQHFRWKSQTAVSLKKPKTIARDAVERVKRGGRVKNDTHARRIVKDTAEARYDSRGELRDLTPGAVITLALSFTAAEWAAVKREPMLLQEAIDYFKTGEFHIDRWWTYWRNLQLEQPNLAKLFLLEIACEFWKDNVNSLIDAVRHISSGLRIGSYKEFEAEEQVPKRRKGNTPNIHYASPREIPIKGRRYSRAARLAAHQTSQPKKRSPVACQSQQASGDHEPETQHKKDSQHQVPRVLVQASAPNDPTPRLRANDRVEGQRSTEASISDYSRLERTSFSNISALLNHDNIPITILSSTQDSLQGSKDGAVHTGQRDLDNATERGNDVEFYLDSVPILQQSTDTAPIVATTTLLKGIRFEKRTLEQIVRQHPNAILGGIWFGGPQGYPPFISLRLSRLLDDKIKLSGEGVYVPGPSRGTGGTVTGGAHLIKLGVFRQMIQRDGFGPIYWNECGGDAFVTMEVTDDALAADFVRGSAIMDS